MTSTNFVAVVLLTLLTACSKRPVSAPLPVQDEAVPVSVARVIEIKLDRVLSEDGTLIPKEEAEVSAEVAGRVEKTHVDLGDLVEAGQEMAQIDTAVYQAQAELAAANVAKAQANSANAGHNLKRTQELRQGKIASDSDLDLAVAQAGQGSAEVKAAEASAALAALDLKRSHVVAPFGAAVAERLINAGDFVRIGTPLYRIVNDRELKLLLQVPELYAGQVQPQQVMRFRVDAFPKQTFEGKVIQVSPAVNPASRSLAVVVLAQNPQRLLKSGMYARGELVMEREVATLVVPLAAVQNLAGVTKVFTVDQGLARVRQVQAGRIFSEQQEILGGLQGTEVVVLTGHTRLYEGAKVRVQEANPAPELERRPPSPVAARARS